MDEYKIYDLIHKISSANECLDYLNKINNLYNNPLKDDINWLIEKVNLIKENYLKEYNKLLSFIEEEAEFITGIF